MDILRTEGLTRQYGVGQAIVTALDHVDLQVERGQFVAIIGASGSGKSTLLHLLGGVDRPDGGKIFVEDVDIATFGEERLAQYRRFQIPGEEAGIGSGTHREISLKIDNKKRQLLAMRNWRNKKHHDYADLYGLIILIDNYNIPEEGLCFF